MNDLYSNITYPVSTNDYVDLGDYSDKKEVKMIKSFNDKIKEIELLNRDSIENEQHKRLDILKAKGIDREVLDIFIDNYCYTQQENYYINASSLNSLKENIYSITGGYCRNIMFDTEDAKTDIDILCYDNYFHGGLDFFYTSSKDKRTGKITYDIPNNTLHVLNFRSVAYNPIKKQMYDAFTLDDDKKDFHLFIYPKEFDFTINLGCISSLDGHLYAPPITMHDIKNKILRPTSLMFDNNGDGMPMDALMDGLDIKKVIRGIRFMVKYDMSLHNSFFKGIKLLFSLCKELKTNDYSPIFYTLKHVVDEPVSIKDEIFSHLKYLGMYEVDKFLNINDFFSYVKERHEKEDYEYKIMLPLNGSTRY